jgi:hypothetical protein
MSVPDCSGFQFSECMMSLLSWCGGSEVRIRARRWCASRGVPLAGQVFSGAGTSSVTQAHLLESLLGEIEVPEIAQQGRQRRWAVSAAPIYATRSCLGRPRQEIEDRPDLVGAARVDTPRSSAIADTSPSMLFPCEASPERTRVPASRDRRAEYPSRKVAVWSRVASGNPQFCDHCHIAPGGAGAKGIIANRRRQQPPTPSGRPR